MARSEGSEGERTDSASTGSDESDRAGRNDLLAIDFDEDDADTITEYFLAEYKGWKLEDVAALTWRQFYGLWERMWARKKNEVIFNARGVVRGLAYVLGGGKTDKTNRSIIAEGAHVDTQEFDATKDGILEHLARAKEVGLDRLDTAAIAEMNLPNTDALYMELYGSKMT